MGGLQATAPNLDTARFLSGSRHPAAESAGPGIHRPTRTIFGRGAQNGMPAEIAAPVRALVLGFRDPIPSDPTRARVARSADANRHGDHLGPTGVVHAGTRHKHRPTRQLATPGAAQAPSASRADRFTLNPRRVHRDPGQRRENGRQTQLRSPLSSSRFTAKRSPRNHRRTIPGAGSSWTWSAFSEWVSPACCDSQSTLGPALEKRVAGV